MTSVNNNPFVTVVFRSNSLFDGIFAHINTPEIKVISMPRGSGENTIEKKLAESKALLEGATEIFTDGTCYPTLKKMQLNPDSLENLVNNAFGKRFGLAGVQGDEKASGMIAKLLLPLLKEYKDRELYIYPNSLEDHIEAEYKVFAYLQEKVKFEHFPFATIVAALKKGKDYAMQQYADYGVKALIKGVFSEENLAKLQADPEGFFGDENNKQILFIAGLQSALHKISIKGAQQAKQQLSFLTHLTDDDCKILDDNPVKWLNKLARQAGIEKITIVDIYQPWEDLQMPDNATVIWDRHNYFHQNGEIVLAKLHKKGHKGALLCLPAANLMKSHPPSDDITGDILELITPLVQKNLLDEL